MRSKSVSPIISTLIVLGIAIVVAGIAFVWTSTYTQEQTKAVEQQADVNTLVQAQSAIGLVLKSATANGRLIIANNSSQPITINQLIIDGNLVSIPPVSIPAGGIASIDANARLSEGQSISLITAAGASKTMTVSGITYVPSTASFSDLLNDQNDINLSRTNAIIAGGEARLSGIPAWQVLKDLNISNNIERSVYPSLALDSNGNPGIAWQDNTSGGNIFYRDWNGSDWTTVKGNLYDDDLNVTKRYFQYYPSLALDINGNPSIAHRDDWFANDISYRDWNGTNWVTVSGSIGTTNLNVSNNIGVSEFASLALDSNGFPSIAWHDNTSGNYEIYYRDWNGTNWVTVKGNLLGDDLNVSKNSGISREPSLALDINGFPSIAWHDNTSGNYEIYYRDWNGTNWVALDSSRPDWLSGWSYRKKFDINGTVDGSLTNYQLKLYVKRSAGTDLNGTVFVGMNVLSDYNDLRFTRADGNTLLDYWIEDANSDTGTVWVEFNSVLASPAANTFYMYYGNPDASKASNADNTFIVYDDFSTQDTSKWTFGNGATVSGGELNLQGFQAYADTNSKINWTGSCAVEMQFRGNAGGRDTAIGVVSADNGADRIRLGDTSYAGYGFYASLFGKYGSGDVAAGSSTSSSRYYRLYLSGTSAKGIRQNTITDPTNYQSINRTLNESVNNQLFSFRPNAGGNPYFGGWVDWARVRNYTANEPVWTNWRTEATNLNVSKNSGSSWFSSLALDSNGNPSITWYDDTLGNNEIFYRDWNGSDWTTARGNLYDNDLNVSKNIESSSDPSLALKANGLPSIAWSQAIAGRSRIYYRDWNGTNWVTVSGSIGTTNVNASNTLGDSYLSSLALDAANGLPSIAWTDNTSGNEEIYYREWDENYASGNAMESIEVDSVTENILKATLTASISILAGTSISFYLSDNNGTTWVPATSGIEVTFSSVGSQLKWRADLNSTNNRTTPRIYDISISYVYEA